MMKKHVTFSNNLPTMGQPIKSSQEDRKLHWYSKQELHEIRLDVLQTIEVMRGVRMRIRGQCSRGLEHLRSEAADRHRRQTVETLLDAVLDEQERQRQEKTHNAIGLARISFAHSSQSRQEARERGKSDAINASTIMSSSMSSKRALTMSEGTTGNGEMVSWRSFSFISSTSADTSRASRHLSLKMISRTPSAAKAAMAATTKTLWKDLSQERVPPSTRSKRHGLLSQAA